MGSLIFLVVFGIILIIAGFFSIGFGVCDEELGVGTMGAIVATMGLCCIIGTYKDFYDMRKNSFIRMYFRQY